MAQELLNNLLNLKTTATEILEWLTSDESNEAQWTNFDNICPRNEFIPFFLDYLREQFISVLQNSNNSKQTPAKKVLTQPQTSNVGKSMKENAQKLEPEASLVESPLGNKDDFRRQVEINTAQQDSTVNDQSGSFKKGNLDNSIGKSIKSPTTKFHTPERNILNQNADSNQAVSSASPQTSTPVANKRNSSVKKRAAFTTCSPSERQDFNPYFKNSVEYESCTDRREGKNISFDDNSFPSLGGRNSNGINYSRSFGKDQSPDLTRSNLSRSNTSISKKILQSPMSPLYSNSASMLSPINSQLYQNRLQDSPPNSNFNHTTSTPEKIASDISKNFKTTRPSLSLSDFITTEPRSSKKGSAKKAQSKSCSKSDGQNDNDISNVDSNTSAGHSENKNKRKLKPTTFHSTDKKGDKENTVFEGVSRPFTQNPQFVVPVIDKSIDDKSCEIRKEVVKINKQNKPENDSNTNATEKQNCPKWKILQRTPSKINKPISTIIPDKTLVENIEVLNILAELYSGFLDKSLVCNPMTELHFIINLITNQYKDNLKQLPSITNDVEEKLQDCNNDDSIKDFKYEKKELSALKKSLNFDDLEDDTKLNHDNDLHCDDKSATELGCSSLIDDDKENLNIINKKLKKLDVDINQITDEQEVADDPSMNKDCVKLYLNTPHNCVYFSAQVLNLQKDFLTCLDRKTCKLLCKNSQMSIFQPELCKYLDSIYDIKALESDKTKSSLNIGIVEFNVCFQIDTDNRENFPSPTAFQNFRKQRDMFYEILKIWEDNHLVRGWSFQNALGRKINAMLAVHPDVTNFIHFTRLFKSQMLISCIQKEQEEDQLDETLNIFKSNKDVNPEKLAHLNKKFFEQLSLSGPVPLPSFPGHQEFYKDFILFASHHMFYTYLKNTFIHEIMELNNTQFAGSDIEDTETQVDEHTKQNFAICLSSLKLLAKFLGFLTSLPYRPVTCVLEDVIASQIVLRSKSVPHIDLQYCLNNAVIQGKLSLTVPWIVDYLSMMDHASLRLPYYKKVLEILYCIYRISNYRAVDNSDELMSPRTAVLVKLSIGWLFELPVFPTELYYSLQAKYNNKILKLICEQQKSIFDAEDSIISIKHSLFLDKLEMVDDSILYSCCPFLRQFNILLLFSGNSNVNNSTSHRHVTPCQLQKPEKKGNTKHLEIQLEEAFFHGQSTSIRTTVEFVSERVASSCVKYIHKNLLPVEKRKNAGALKRLVEENYSYLIEHPELLKNTILKDMNALSIETSKIVKEESDKVIPKMCESRVNQSIESLLADDCSKAIKEMCMKIATRMAMERIDQWIESHTVGSSTFMKDMELEFNKIMKESEEVLVEKKYHNMNAASPTNILDGLREIIWNLMETRGQRVTTGILIQFFDQLYMCLTERSDLKVGSEKIITSLSIDLCLYSILYRHDLFTEEVQDKVYKIWKMDNLKLSDSDSPLSRIFSPRNVMLMSQSLDNTVWLNFGKLLKNLLKRSILTIDSLSEQAIALFRREWPVTISKNLSVCLGQAIADYKSSDEETERIRYLLGWVAEAHNDIGCDGF